MKKYKIFELIMTIAPVILILLLEMDIIDFNPDHIIIALGCIPVAFKLVSEIRSDKLEKFSTANVLAVGYVKNFLGPLIEAMLAQQLVSSQKKIFIYIPDKVSDFDHSRMHILKTSLNTVPLSCETKTILISQTGDKRNIIEVTNTKKANSYYVDFPNTLSSLNALLDYEMKNKLNDDHQSKKDERGRKYIAVFKREVENILTESGQIDFTGFVSQISALH